MVETQIALGALEAFLDRPAKAGRAGEFGERGPFGREHQIISAFVWLRAVAPDQQPALEALLGRPGQRHPRPVVEPQALRSLAGGEPRPALGGQVRGGASRIGVDEPLSLRPQSHRLVRADRQHIGLAALLQHAAQTIVAAIKRVRQHPPARRARFERRGDQLPRHRDLGGEDDLFGHIGLGATLRVAWPAFRQIEPPVD